MKIAILAAGIDSRLGEAVGINFIANKDINKFIQRLEECEDNDYFERGQEISIAKDGLRIAAVDISQYDSMEVDFKEDLANANNLFQK